MFFPMIMGATPGSTTYSTAGTFSFTVPEYNTLTVIVKGGGGGGGGGAKYVYYTTGTRARSSRRKSVVGATG